MSDVENFTLQLEQTNTLLAQLAEVSQYLTERQTTLIADIEAAKAQAVAAEAALAAAEAEAQAAEKAKWDAQQALDALQQQQLDALTHKVDNFPVPEQDIATIVANLVAQVDKLKSEDSSRAVKRTNTYGRMFNS